jgi:hypothetical protein
MGIPWGRLNRGSRGPMKFLMELGFFGVVRTTMKVDPEELVELKNHGSMKLRCAVARAMLLSPRERRETAIVRQSEPSVLHFRTIKSLSAAL